MRLFRTLFVYKLTGCLLEGSLFLGELNRMVLMVDMLVGEWLIAAIRVLYIRKDRHRPVLVLF